MGKSKRTGAPRHTRKQSRAAMPPVAPVMLGDVSAALEKLAPLHLAESWDNVGLLSGEKSAKVQRVLLAMDLTPTVYDEALRQHADLLVVYHPPIFKPLKTLRVDSQEPPALAIKLATHHVWIYSPHTALDTVEGGTNDVLANLLGAQVTGSFSNYPAQGSYLKLVTFVPQAAIETVAQAVFAAGAGHIGVKSKYKQCSFRTPGTGTFFGDHSTNPAVGQKDQLEHVPEIRFETILPAGIAGQVVSALRSAHPYEEPAFDLLKIKTPPESVGLGRFAKLPNSLTVKELALRAKRKLGLPTATIMGEPDRAVTTLAIMAGSSGRMALDQAFNKQPYDCLITGELKHHDALAYHAAGIAAICLGHAQSERPVLGMLQRALERQFDGLKVSICSSEGGIATVL